MAQQDNRDWPMQFSGGPLDYTQCATHAHIINYEEGRLAKPDDAYRAASKALNRLSRIRMQFRKLQGS